MNVLGNIRLQVADTQMGARIRVVSARPPLLAALLTNAPTHEAAARARTVLAACPMAHAAVLDAALLAADAAGNTTVQQTDIEALAREYVFESLAREAANWPEFVAWIRADATSDRVLSERLAAWIEAELLGSPAGGWLATDQGADIERTFSRSYLARRFAACAIRPGMGSVPIFGTVASPDTLLSDTRFMAELFERRFAQQPSLSAGAAECGPVARWVRHPAIADWIGVHGLDLYARALCRLLDLADLANRLRCGGWDGLLPQSRTLDDGAGVAAISTPRGVLAHAVRVEDGRIAHINVIAPTEWKLHPNGGWLRAVQALVAEEPMRKQRLALWLDLLDPCAPVQIDYVREVVHA